jgi:hypothetical protein
LEYPNSSKGSPSDNNKYVKSIKLFNEDFGQWSFCNVPELKEVFKEKGISGVSGLKLEELLLKLVDSMRSRNASQTIHGECKRCSFSICQ